MMRHSYQLDNAIHKIRENTVLLKTEIGVVEAGENTLAVLIKMDSHKVGCVFHGECKLVLDTVIETENGAVGKPIEKTVEKPFIMIGEVEHVLSKFATTNKHDLAKIGYANESEFIKRAEELCRRFFGEQSGQAYDTFEQGFVFAFPNNASGLDLLVAKDSKIVYKTCKMMFVSNENRVVLKTSGKMVVSNGLKSVVLSSKKVTI
ncbi:MAG: hypothetical protein QXL54_02705 [Candidatus Bathyarchaeia archaeon]